MKNTEAATELFSKTPPTEPGWYWLQDPDGDEFVKELFPEFGAISEPCWNMGRGELWTNSDIVAYRFRVGPRIPSPQECADAAAKAASQPEPRTAADVYGIRMGVYGYLWIDRQGKSRLTSELDPGSQRVLQSRMPAMEMDGRQVRLPPGAVVDFGSSLLDLIEREQEVAAVCDERDNPKPMTAGEQVELTKGIADVFRKHGIDRIRVLPEGSTITFGSPSSVISETKLRDIKTPEQMTDSERLIASMIVGSDGAPPWSIRLDPSIKMPDYYMKPMSVDEWVSETVTWNAQAVPVVESLGVVIRTDAVAC